MANTEQEERAIKEIACPNYDPDMPHFWRVGHNAVSEIKPIKKNGQLVEVTWYYDLTPFLKL